jgi:gliding motility-associated-like protein
VEDSIEILTDLIPPIFSLTSDTINCNKANALIQINSLGNYTLEEVNSSEIISQNELEVIVGTDGITEITMTAENGCQTTESILVFSDIIAPSPIGFEDFTLNCFLVDSLVAWELPPNIDVFIISDGDTIQQSDLFIDGESELSVLLLDIKNGCTTIENFMVDEDFYAPDFSISSNEINCVDNLATFEILSEGNVDDILYPTGVSYDVNAGYTTNLPGSYEFIIIYDNGCIATKTKTVEIDTISPALEVFDDQFTCSINSLFLEIEVNPDDELLFQWSGPDGFTSNIQSPEIYNPGEYSIEILDFSNGCTTIGMLNIIEEMTSISSQLDIEEALCLGDEPKINISQINGGVAPYDVIYFDEQGEEIALADISFGEYHVEIIDVNGCDTAYTFTIVEPKDFYVDTEHEITLTVGDEVEILAFTDLDEEEIEEIIWTPSEFLSCSDCLNPVVQNLENDTTFYITIVNLNGCIRTDSIIVRLVVEYTFFTPNVFSPNDDGINDVFYIFSNVYGETATVQRMGIYDRWGNQVYIAENFPPNDMRYGWDGRHNNKNVQQGVYGYYAILELENGKIVKLKGDVSIVR